MAFQLNQTIRGYKIIKQTFIDVANRELGFSYLTECGRCIEAHKVDTLTEETQKKVQLLKTLPHDVFATLLDEFEHNADKQQYRCFVFGQQLDNELTATISKMGKFVIPEKTKLELARNVVEGLYTVQHKLKAVP